MKFFEFKDAFENESVKVISITLFMHENMPKLSVEFKVEDDKRLQAIELSAPLSMRPFARRERKCSPNSLELVELESGFICFAAEPL